MQAGEPLHQLSSATLRATPTTATGQTSNIIDEVLSKSQQSSEWCTSSVSDEQVGELWPLEGTTPKRMSSPSRRSAAVSCPRSCKPTPPHLSNTSPIPDLTSEQNWITTYHTGFISLQGTMWHLATREEDPTPNFDADMTEALSHAALCADNMSQDKRRTTCDGKEVV
ncbi:hypothetical protein E2C01_001229 [Portunus trituberculatus]|uniref:Uncharacterized protein n=1 Tax=Portunus trituberculatus TaxID=210409 RepID=A0A5B7CGM1_PORTR|nr:hypothetical protein [Portunus trituberculatus]